MSGRAETSLLRKYFKEHYMRLKSKIACYALFMIFVAYSNPVYSGEKVVQEENSAAPLNEAGKTAKVTVDVRDNKSGERVLEATVSIEGDVRNGALVIFEEIKPGHYLIVVKAPGYASVSKFLNVNPSVRSEYLKVILLRKLTHKNPDN